MNTNDNRPINRLPIMALLLIALLVLGFMVWNIIFIQGKILHNAEKYYKQEQVQNINASLKQVEQEGRQLTLQMANNTKLRDAFEERDYQQLNKLLQPVYKQWRNQYGVKELELISSQGSVVWSSNNLLDAGYDLSYKRIVGKALQDKTAIAAAESSETDNLIVTTLPMFSGDEYVGLCKLGISMQSMGDQLEKLGAGRYAIYDLDGIQSNLVWPKKSQTVPLNTADLKKLHDGENVSRALDNKTTLAVVPIKDIDGICIAYIQGQISMQAFRQARQSNFLMLFLIAIFILSAGFILLRGRLGKKSGYDDGFGTMPKINSVAFNINSDKMEIREEEDR